MCLSNQQGARIWKVNLSTPQQYLPSGRAIGSGRGPTSSVWHPVLASVYNSGHAYGYSILNSNPQVMQRPEIHEAESALQKKKKHATPSKPILTPNEAQNLSVQDAKHLYLPLLSFPFGDRGRQAPNTMWESSEERAGTDALMAFLPAACVLQAAQPPENHTGCLNIYT